MYMLEKTAGEPLAITFYLVLVIVGSNFIVNLFLAVLFDSFFESQAKAAEHERQVDAATAPAQSEETPVAAPAALQRRKSMGYGAAKTRFNHNAEGWVYVLITLNTLSMCATYYGQPEVLEHVLDACNVFFTSAFFVEMVTKLCLQGRSYFSAGWNRFDFVVTWCSVVDLLLDFWGHDTDFLRALRVARVMRLLRLNRKMRRFEDTAAKVAELVINRARAHAAHTPRAHATPAPPPHRTARERVRALHAHVRHVHVRVRVRVARLLGSRRLIRLRRWLCAPSSHGSLGDPRAHHGRVHAPRDGAIWGSDGLPAPTRAL